MNRLRLFILVSFFATVMSFALTSPASANKRYASIVIDADTGTVLRARYADKRLHPASLTKMMTLYMTFEAIERGKLGKNQRIWVSPHAASMVPSKLGLKPRSTIKVEDAIYSLVTKSANDAAVTLAEAIAGTESQFALAMTRKAHQLGMRNTRFKNASGLHHPSQVSTARDMAKLSQALIKHYPQYYKYFSTNNFSYKGHSYHNHNRLMKSYTGMDGIKTGYVAASGFNLAASAVRNNRRLIGVVFGGRTSKSRNAHMASILDEGFAKVKNMGFAMAKAPPLPSPKPEALVLASLQKSGQLPDNVKVAQVTGGKIGEDFQMMGLVIGEGDVDAEETAKVLASLRSMAQTNGGLRQNASYTATTPVAPTPKPVATQPEWSVQIGAFDTQESSTAALKSAAKKLPRSYVMATKPQIVKAKSNSGTVYRARFSGLTRQKAIEGCRILKNCIVLSNTE